MQFADFAFWDRQPDYIVSDVNLGIKSVLHRLNNILPRPKHVQNQFQDIFFSYPRKVFASELLIFNAKL